MGGAARDVRNFKENRRREKNGHILRRFLHYVRGTTTFTARRADI